MSPDALDQTWWRLAARKEMRPAWLVLALALAATMMFWTLSRSYDYRALESDFRLMTQTFMRDVSTAMTSYEGALRAARGLLAADPSITRGGWREFVSSLEIDAIHSGVQGLGYVEMISPQELAGHEAAFRQIHGASYAVHPAGTRDQYSAIVYLEPEDWRNKRAIGYDMYSEPVRRAAMERARSTDAIAASAKVRLVQETDVDEQAGLVLYLPVFGPPVRSDSSARVLRGFVYIPIRMGEFVKGVAGPDLERYSMLMQFEIFDGSEAAPGALLYESHPSLSPGATAEITRTTGLRHNGRTWTMRFSSLPAFDARVVTTPELVLLAGTGLSLLLWALAALLAARQVQELQAREHAALLMRELSHRVKNTLAIVQSIANRSLLDQRSVGEARKVFLQRLQALSRAHTLLVASDWKGADLRELVMSELSAFGARAEISGPPIRLRPQIAHTFSLLIHELSTNAAKHGALSVDKGRVLVSWQRQHSGGEPTFRFTWQEVGGPRVAPPQRSGFGVLLLKQAVAHGSARPPVIEFTPEGLIYSMELPLDSVGTLDTLEESWPASDTEH